MSTRYMHEKAEPNPSFSRRSNGPQGNPGSEGDRKEEKRQRTTEKAKGLAGNSRRDTMTLKLRRSHHHQHHLHQPSSTHTRNVHGLYHPMANSEE